MSNHLERIDVSAGGGFQSTGISGVYSHRNRPEPNVEYYVRQPMSHEGEQERWIEIPILSVARNFNSGRYFYATDLRMMNSPGFQRVFPTPEDTGPLVLTVSASPHGPKHALYIQATLHGHAGTVWEVDSVEDVREWSRRAFEWASGQGFDLVDPNGVPISGADFKGDSGE